MKRLNRDKTLLMKPKKNTPSLPERWDDSIRWFLYGTGWVADIDLNPIIDSRWYTSEIYLTDWRNYEINKR